MCGKYNTYVITRQGRDREGEGLPPLRFLCDVTDQPHACDSGELDRSRTAPHSRLAHRLLLNPVLRPSPTPGRNRIPQSVATHDCRRDTVLGGAVASRVPHPQTGDGYCLGTVESHRATRRCQTSPGTASRDAVPQQTFIRHSAALQTSVSASRNAAGTTTGVHSLLWPPLLFRYGYKI